MAIRYIVISSHTSDFPNPIQFSKGDQLILGKRDTEYHGWIWVTTADNNEGWAPESLIERTSSNSGNALVEYTARELDTHIGDIVSCIKELQRAFYSHDPQWPRAYGRIAVLGYFRAGRILLSRTSASSYRTPGFNHSGTKGAQSCLLNKSNAFCLRKGQVLFSSR